MKKLILFSACITLLYNVSTAQCTVPSSPANIFLSATDTAASVYFDSTATANQYVAFMSTSATLSATPVNGTAYTVGQSFGGGKVVYIGSNYLFKVDALTANTTYYFFIYSDNVACSGEPKYSTSSLDGSITTFNGASGIPSGYYNGLSGLTCAPLKTALYNIIKPTVANPDPTYKGILGASQLTDGRRNDNNTKFIVWDIYSDNPSGAEPYEFTFGSPYQDRGLLGNVEGEKYNREHTMPQAWFASAEPMQSDMFIVIPSDKKVNSLRANYPYGKVGTPTYTTLNGSKLGNNISGSFTSTVFEPIDAYKGDVARAYFYDVTAYEDVVAGWASNSNASDVLSGNTYPALNSWYISLMYQWHQLDPVSQKELDRNNHVYMIQGARNPYIDHPEYVALVWQCTGLIPVTIIDFNAIKANNRIILNWYATHEANFKEYQVERSTNAIDFTNIGTVQGRNLANYSLNDNSLPTTSMVYYRLKMVDIDNKVQYSKIISVKLNSNFSNALVYPNPSFGKLNIQLEKPLTQNTSVIIHDIAGRKVMATTASEGIANVALNISDLPAGRYIVTLTNSTMTIKESFVVIK
jgi:endonuclease I